MEIPLKEITEWHNEYLKEMGWTNQTLLEDAGLIASEIGELINEARGDEPTQQFKIELADIILRCLGVAGKHYIDIEHVMRTKMEINRRRGNRGRLK